MVLKGVKNGAIIIDNSSRNWVVNVKRRKRIGIYDAQEFILPWRDFNKYRYA